MRYFAVIMRDGPGALSSVVVEAERHAEVGAAHLFHKDDRLVYRCPAAFVADVVGHGTRGEAERAVRAHRERLAGAATIHVHEAASPTGRRRRRSGDGTANFAEGIRIVVDEGR